jgi:hypothetical protein
MAGISERFSGSISLYTLLLFFFSEPKTGEAVMHMVHLPGEMLQVDFAKQASLH